mgnify:CR=1 FL=1
MCMSYLNGDTKKALEIQMKGLPLVDALFSEVNPIPVKKALNLMGMEVGPLRLPLTEMEEKNAKVEFEDKKDIQVFADDFYIEQVLTNYLTNAIKNVKEINGENRIDEFIQRCFFNQWFVEKVEIDNKIELYNKAEEEIIFDK